MYRSGAVVTPLVNAQHRRRGDATMMEVLFNVRFFLAAFAPQSWRR